MGGFTGRDGQLQVQVEGAPGGRWGTLRPADATWRGWDPWPKDAALAGAHRVAAAACRQLGFTGGAAQGDIYGGRTPSESPVVPAALLDDVDCPTGGEPGLSACSFSRAGDMPNGQFELNEGFSVACTGATAGWCDTLAARTPGGANAWSQVACFCMPEGQCWALCVLVLCASHAQKAVPGRPPSAPRASHPARPPALPAGTSQLRVRLAGGPTPREGRVEVLSAGTWRPLTDSLSVCTPCADPSGCPDSLCADMGFAVAQVGMMLWLQLLCLQLLLPVVCSPSRSTSAQHTPSRMQGHAEGTESGRRLLSRRMRALAPPRQVVCRQLGFGGGAPRHGDFYGAAPAPALAHANCSGDEPGLLDCFLGAADPWYSHTLGVACQGGCSVAGTGGPQFCFCLHARQRGHPPAQSQGSRRLAIPGWLHHPTAFACRCSAQSGSKPTLCLLACVLFTSWRLFRVRVSLQGRMTSRTWHLWAAGAGPRGGSR